MTTATTSDESSPAPAYTAVRLRRSVRAPALHGWDGLRRAIFVCAIAALVFDFPSVVRAIGRGAGKVPLPIQVSTDPGDNLKPAVSIAADGSVTIAWTHIVTSGSAASVQSARILATNSSEPVRSSLPVLSLPEVPSTGPRLSFDVRRQLAWTQSTGVTGTVSWSDLTSAPAPKTWRVPGSSVAGVGVSSGGVLHYVWAQGATLNHVASARRLTSTLQFSTNVAITALDVLVGERGDGHVAWISSDAASRTAGVHYARLVHSQADWVLTGTTVITASQVAASASQIAGEGISLVLGEGESGQAHLCWRAEDGLYCANSRDWGSVQRVVELPPSGPVLPWAMAIGPGDVVHLAWVKGDTLLYANSASWQLTQAILAKPVAIASLDMAVDATARTHVVWATTGGGQGSVVQYLAPNRLPLQAAIAYPLGGETLAQDTLLCADTNLPSADVQSVEFYLQDQSTGLAEGPLISIGADQDGSDGWKVPLHIAELESNVPYRVVTLATDSDGMMARAVGKEFMVQNRAQPWVWLDQSSTEDGGTGQLRALVSNPQARMQRLDLYMRPEIGGTDINGAAGVRPSLDDQAALVGSYAVPQRQEWPLVRWQDLPLDSRAFPDGSYVATVVPVDRAGRRDYGRSATEASVENARYPRLEVLAPISGQVVNDILRIVATSPEGDGALCRVDFALERTLPLLRTRYDGVESLYSQPYLVWLGSDMDGSDGWGLEVRVDESLDGDDWRVRAAAVSADGPSAVVHSTGTFAIVGRQRPHLQIVSPSAHSTVQATVTVSVWADAGSQHLEGVQAYIEDKEGMLRPIGYLAGTGGRLALEWNTRQWPDGVYSLWIMARHRDGQASYVRREELVVSNGWSFRITQPAQGAVLRGSAHVCAQPTVPLSGSVQVQWFCRDEHGQLHPIGSAPLSEQGWCAVWNTLQVLDGNYGIVAVLGDDPSRARVAETSVVVNNTTPSIRLRSLDRDTPWRGTRRINWRVAHPANKPTVVSVEYSPDGGEHWLGLALGIPSAESFSWDTTLYPDSSHGLLRLTASDGTHSGQTTSQPFVVNNLNEAPKVHLFSPASGTVYTSTVPLTWKSLDPDGDPLVVDIEYRRGNGPWQIEGLNLSDIEQHQWHVVGLAPGSDYELRVTVRDPAGLAADDSVSRLSLSTDRAPVVDLVWPNRSARLQRDEVVLWTASDPDADLLLVDLYYSDNAGQTWLPLAEDVPNTGYYPWQVSYLPSGSRYRLRIVAHDTYLEASDESDGMFTIGDDALADIVFLSVASNDRLAGVQCVRWSCAEIPRTGLLASLTLRPLHRTQARSITAGVPNVGFWLWDTRGWQDGAYELRVTLRDPQTGATTTFARPVLIANGANRPPHVVLQSPVGGEYWGGRHLVQWLAWDGDLEPLTATLSVSIDGGERWEHIGSVDARCGSYLWDSDTVALADKCLLRVSVSDSVTVTSATTPSTVYLARVEARPPHVLLTSPDSNGHLLRGDTVTWLSDDLLPRPRDVALALSADGGTTWVELAKGIHDSGEYAFAAEALKTGEVYRVRLCVTAGQDSVQVTSVPFRATPAFPGRLPEVHVLAPIGGEKWSGLQEVRWQARDQVMGQNLRVSLDISSDGGLRWVSLGSDVKNTGVYHWDTSRLPNGIYVIRVTADNSQAQVSQTSAPFWLSNAGRFYPTISMTHPRGGETWSGTQEIRWRTQSANGRDCRVEFAYSLDRGRNWHTFAYGMPNTGSFLCDTTTLPNSDQVWVRGAVSDGDLTGYDLVDYPINVRNRHGPQVALLSPQGGERWMGKQWIVWTSEHVQDRPVSALLEISENDGRDWEMLASDLPAQGRYLWNTVSGRDPRTVLVRVTVSDGLQSAVDATAKAVIVRSTNAAQQAFYLP